MKKGGEEMKTVLITGASSGIGRETAKLFQQKGLNVIATMRKPEIEDELNKLSNVELLYCDVTDNNSMKEAIDKGIRRFGAIDVLVNNAGYYTVGPLEAATAEQIKRQIDTNLLGVINMTKAILPHFRERQAGVIINLSSIAGIVSIPLQSLYHATKFAIEGFSESLQYELNAFHIKVKLIEPGTIKTNFCGRSMTITQDESLTTYSEYANKVIANLIRNGNAGSMPIGVAKTIYKAAIDNRRKMRYSVGRMKGMIKMKKVLPLHVYQYMVKSIIEK